MIKPKSHIKKIFRTPAPGQSRMGCLRMDKNEYLPCIDKKVFRGILKTIKPEHFSIHPEVGPLYKKISLCVGVPEKNIVVTAGSDNAIRSTFEVFVGPGDKVIIPDPTFAMYYIYSDIAGARMEKVGYDANLNIEVDDILKKIDNATKLIAIANPNSPTGTVFDQNELNAIVKKASRYGAVVLIDEAYYPFYASSMLDRITKHDNLIVTRTFSKALGLAGLRIGFLASNDRIAKLIFAVKPMYEITTLSANAALFALERYKDSFKYAEKVRAAKEDLERYFMKRGYTVFTGYANFIHVDFGKRRNEIVNHLIRNKVLFKHSFDRPCLKRYCRFTVGPKKEIERFIRIFNKIHKKV